MSLGEYSPLDIARPGPPLIMGILNVTPDSFSDGGRHNAVDAAVEHARLMLSEGADIIDVGGESTRPGAARVDAAEQIRRTEPVVRALAKLTPRPVISIDTTLSPVAAAAVDAGATILNDVSAGREDPGMLALAAKRGLPIVLMHMQGEPGTMQKDPRYTDVVTEVLAFLQERTTAAAAAGVPRERIVIDPGIGFGKSKDHNLALLARLDRIVAMGYGVMLGTSRKRFMGAICTKPNGEVPKPADLVPATCATTALGVLAGVRIFRVHDVAANRQAADVAWSIRKLM